MRRLGFFDRRIRGFRIVELGALTVLVALVHPAEFIVLTFKQEMQTS